MTHDPRNTIDPAVLKLRAEMAAALLAVQACLRRLPHAPIR